MGCMLILMSLSQLHPPEGKLRCAPARGAPAPSVDREFPFNGWLGMLRALSEVLGSEDHDALG